MRRHVKSTAQLIIPRHTVDRVSRRTTLTSGSTEMVDALLLSSADG
jgi:hypothetical protein